MRFIARVRLKYNYTMLIQQSLTNPVSKFDYKTYLTSPVLPFIYLDPPTPQEIYNIIANLKTKKSTRLIKFLHFLFVNYVLYYRQICAFYFPLHSNLEFFPIALNLLELFQSIRQNPKKKLQTTAQYQYLPVSPKF